LFIGMAEMAFVGNDGRVVQLKRGTTLNRE